MNQNPKITNLFDKFRRVAQPVETGFAEKIAVLERRQEGRREHVAQLQLMIDRKQLEIDNLKRTRGSE